MRFTLEALPAQHGDCLFLHYGSAADPQLILIDGGPSRVYREHLRPRLEELRQTLSDPLRLRLLMVSHIDDDHVNGVEQLLEELDAVGANAELPFRITTLWHNSFDDIVGPGAAELAQSAEILEPAMAAGLTDDDPVDRSMFESDEQVSSDTRLMVASVSQGLRVRKLAKKLGIAINDPDPDGDGLIVARRRGAPIDLGHGLGFRILGPSRARVAKLREAWRKDLEAKAAATAVDAGFDAGLEDMMMGGAVTVPSFDSPRDNPSGSTGGGSGAAHHDAVTTPLEPAAFVDKSVFNLSSLIVLAEMGGATMLLPGDARGDDILKGIGMAGLFDSKRKFTADLLKLPHHGSDRNVSTEFFRRVKARHYVCSGDGFFGNPEIATIQMLIEARRGDGEPYTLHFTYRLDEMHASYPASELRCVLECAKSHGHAIDVREPAVGATSVTIDLGDGG